MSTEPYTLLRCEHAPSQPATVGSARSAARRAGAARGSIAQPDANKRGPTRSTLQQGKLPAAAAATAAAADAPTTAAAAASGLLRQEGGGTRPEQGCLVAQQVGPREVNHPQPALHPLLLPPGRRHGRCLHAGPEADDAVCRLHQDTRSRAAHERGLRDAVNPRALRILTCWSERGSRLERSKLEQRQVEYGRRLEVERVPAARAEDEEAARCDYPGP